MGEVEELREKVKTLETVIAGLERILKLNEQEIANGEEIVQMYEQISDFARKELVEARETQAATEAAGSLSAGELKQSFARIEELENQNKSLKDEAARLRG